MRPYIIINGRNSQDIEGLLISTLPPITKPLKRISKEEISGMDGDIITELGYSAYDKQITIGLTYNYNIDDVISYFDSIGIITFSNEPDKYYKFAIYEQIDFEKLIKFKTATVTIHVQPFKYSSVDKEKVFDAENNTEFTVRNNGNIYSKPTIAIEGEGIIELHVNQQQIFVIDMTNTNKVVINASEMNAYYENGNLANRIIIGDYDNLRLLAGANVISYVGNVTKLTVSDYTRWI